MHFVLSPLSVGLLLALLLTLGWRRLPRGLRWLGLVIELVLIGAMCPFGANALVWQIESRVPVPAACAAPQPETIVVLSGGFERAPADVDDFAALSAVTIERAVTGVALWRRTPDATLVFAGGGPYAISESALLQRFAEQVGVPAAQIRGETRSQTTWENAAQLKLLAPALSQRIWLVSSALHLPRASVAFRAAGFDPCLYASDRSYVPPGGIGYYVPQSSALRKSEAAIHELVGQLVYQWRAR